MTLDNALSMFELDKNDLSLENIKRQYKILAKKYHPDSNGGVDLGFNKLSEAYLFLLSYIDVNTDYVEINNNSKYHVIFNFLIWSDIFGIEDEFFYNQLLDIYNRLDSIIFSDEFFDIDKYIKEEIIKIFKLKYSKSFNNFGISDSDKYFKNLSSNDKSLNDTFIELSRKYHMFAMRKFRQFYSLSKRLLKNDELAYSVLTKYVKHLAITGTDGDREDFTNYVLGILNISNNSGNNNYDNNITTSKIDKENDEVFELINTNYQEEETSFSEGDIVYNKSYGFGPLKFGIIVNENGVLVVKHYIFARDDFKIFKERFSTIFWEKVDNLIDNGNILGAKVIHNHRNTIMRNGLIHLKDNILFANSDYSKFAVSSSFNNDEYCFAINMWPEFISKEEIRTMIKNNVYDKILGGDNLSISDNKVKKIGTNPNIEN